MTKKKKRAITLAGGGPAAGIHIGVLSVLEREGIEFDVYALSCIGAWVGIVYNTRSGPDRAKQTYEFFETYCFRDDRSYEWFPINKGFGTNCPALWRAWAEFPALKTNKWSDLVLPAQIRASLFNWLKILGDSSRWTHQEFNNWVLNDVLAVNPMTRYLTSMIYKSHFNGLSKIYYNHSKVLEEVFQGERLYEEDRPEIYHNAWRMPKGNQPGKIQLFKNRKLKSRDGTEDYLRISHKSLCSCSALPFIEESVSMRGYTYTEGALVDTVNFKNLLRDHPDLDEVWVNRIVDESEVRRPKDLAESLANLPQQFAAELGKADIKMFRQHLLNQSRMRPRVVEIPMNPDTEVTFDWNHANLKRGFSEGADAARRLLASDKQLSQDTVES
ncbi:Predicted esterase of the alpha-beta hydrolase superfamily [Variovorax sp. HW608]|uniref:patatin-like phospholipase family protein n=1 Tax=Variovorax sp. HW608 TaxID=1034889 RepID=UPI00081FD0D8|nr:patatin-like phospholipase family protein [Variovorax sp. HW608]SCK11355.1 Predicted esterase of the alpha-beta hydrolase superfamily [Variovorax sp. HW608]